jgi:hypothetical protein
MQCNASAVLMLLLLQLLRYVLLLAPWVAMAAGAWC